MHPFNRNLRRLCEQRGISQSDLAGQLGVTQSAISKYFNGQLPNFETGIHIAQILDVDPVSLLHTPHAVREPDVAYQADKALKESILELDETGRKQLMKWLVDYV